MRTKHFVLTALLAVILIGTSTSCVVVDAFTDDPTVLKIIQYDGDPLTEDDVVAQTWKAEIDQNKVRLRQNTLPEDSSSYVIVIDFEHKEDGLPEVKDMTWGPAGRGFYRRVHAGLVEIQSWDLNGEVSGRVSLTSHAFYGPTVFWIDLSESTTTQ